ncbi:hypothetical protein F5884DRAFT_37985 [Xylogone sp. PMI_703]|nr:hypothetical protein F5884DRAFT_37985 [Xylogone sp. PMI_703]
MEVLIVLSALPRGTSALAALQRQCLLCTTSNAARRDAVASQKVGEGDQLFLFCFHRWDRFQRVGPEPSRVRRHLFMQLYRCPPFQYVTGGTDDHPRRLSAGSPLSRVRFYVRIVPFLRPAGGPGLSSIALAQTASGRPEARRTADSGSVTLALPSGTLRRSLPQPGLCC